jgi:hypothetical protein
VIPAASPYEYREARLIAPVPPPSMGRRRLGLILPASERLIPLAGAMLCVLADALAQALVAMPC